MSQKFCQFGEECKRKDCWYKHQSNPKVPTAPTTSTVLCRAGDECTFGGKCRYFHPKSTFTSTKKVSASKAATATKLSAFAVPFTLHPSLNLRECDPDWLEKSPKVPEGVCPLCLNTPPNDGKTCQCCGIMAFFCEQCVEDGEACPSCSGFFDNPEFDNFFNDVNEDEQAFLDDEIKIANTFQDFKGF